MLQRISILTVFVFCFFLHSAQAADGSYPLKKHAKRTILVNGKERRVYVLEEGKINLYVRIKRAPRNQVNYTWFVEKDHVPVKAIKRSGLIGSNLGRRHNGDVLREVINDNSPVLAYYDAHSEYTFKNIRRVIRLYNEATDTTSNPRYTVKKCTDFEITGTGSNEQWNKTEWTTFTRIQKEGSNYESKSKMLYSEKGIYLLFYGTDEKITTQNWNDFQNIYDGDVFEVFFHTDPSKAPYFEYEINPLQKQLILTLSRTGKHTQAWLPWTGEDNGDKLVKRKVNIVGGKQEIGASIKSWTAEVFFPYSLLALLPSAPPKSGTTWNANFCRIDYDGGKQIEYSWSPSMTTGFHALEHFQPIVFE